MRSMLRHRAAMALIRHVEHRAPDKVIGGGADPYLRRWYLLPRNPLLNIYLHHFLRDDDPRALHDHPWPNLSLLLRGCYWEVCFAQSPGRGMVLPALIERFRVPFRPVLRRPRTAHRIRLMRNERNQPIPCWSLFLTGPRLREWGFWCPLGRWVHWRSFTAGPRGETVGRGCD